MLAVGLGTSTVSASTYLSNYYATPETWDISRLDYGEEKSVYFPGGFTITMGKGAKKKVMKNQLMNVFSMDKETLASRLTYSK